LEGPLEKSLFVTYACSLFLAAFHGDSQRGKVEGIQAGALRLIHLPAKRSE
jgi:hypothetical protein